MIAPLLLAIAALADVPADPGAAPRVVVTQTDDSKFPEITVYFELRRPDGTFVRDAAREEFRVAEDGRDRPLVGFEAPITVSKKPTTLVLVVDRSGSMREGDKITGLKRAVRTFLDGLPEGSRVAVIAFGSDVELACPFTTDRARVQAAVDRLRPFGGTRFFDAVDEALKLLETEPGRRAVLALTDGKDEDSELAIGVPIDEARRLNLPVHTLGLGQGGEIDAEALDKIATDTRGQSYRARDAEALKAIYQELAERIGSTYSVTYSTDRKVPDGTLRPIRVAYAKAPEASAGETAVFIPGLVVAAPGWPGLFLVMVLAMGGLLVLPGWLGRRKLAGSHRG
jgi:VWFA-related protein